MKIKVSPVSLHAGGNAGKFGRVACERAGTFPRCWNNRSLCRDTRSAGQSRLPNRNQSWRSSGAAVVAAARAIDPVSRRGEERRGEEERRRPWRGTGGFIYSVHKAAQMAPAGISLYQIAGGHQKGIFVRLALTVGLTHRSLSLSGRGSRFCTRVLLGFLAPRCFSTG